MAQQKAEAQAMEIQLRIIAVQAACGCAKPGEPLKTTQERITALSKYLFSGKV
jgi:hypothetical protein